MDYKVDKTDAVGDSLLLEKLEIKKPMNIIKKVWAWVVYSSENAGKISLTLRGLKWLIPSLVIFLGVLHTPVTQDQLTALLEAVIAVIAALGTFISAMTFLYGLARKIFNTANGTNDVINSQ